MAHKTHLTALTVLATGAALMTAATAGLPGPWAAPILASAGLCLITAVLRSGRGATTVPVLGVVGLAAGAVVPGGHLNPLWALLVAVATVAYLIAWEAHTTGLSHGRVPGEALGAVVVAVAAAALTALSTVAGTWLLPVGLAAGVLAFALAHTHTDGRRS
ncbi:hypothetical protein ABZ890_43280 [Streptomyces sp. NPDC046984]|uniref:hypothetical protein n=1 Tax=Streptomyces sp. NPDC046984 TaxID=3155138 RepID=UPI0033E36671